MTGRHKSHWIDPSEPDRLPPDGGAYILVLRLERPLPLAVPRLGEPELPAGNYVYAGSTYGPGGIRARVARHFRTGKPARWHVDHLTAAAGSLHALAVPGGNECDLVSKLASHDKFCAPVPGFGSSDCRRCTSHLLQLR